MICILRAVVAADPDVEVAAVFGSSARARNTAASDVDIYVRLRPGTRWSTDRAATLSRALEAAARAEIDLVVEDRNETSTILRMEVARHGVLLFERTPGGWTSVRAEAMVDYADMQPFMDRVGQGIRHRVRERAGG